MRADILVVICYPVVITAKLTEQNVNSASAKFKGVKSKPSDENKTSVVGERQHLGQCMKICLFTADCLLTVFDDNQRQCSLYNSSTLAHTLGSQETAVMKETASSKVSCVSLTYNSEVGGCVQLFKTKKNWTDAEAECQNLHKRSHLVAITDERKQQAVDKLAAGVSSYFIGGHRAVAGSDPFVWISNGDEITYTNWASGQPDNHNDNQDCLKVKRSQQGWEWWDGKCDVLRAFFCELI